MKTKGTVVGMFFGLVLLNGIAREQFYWNYFLLCAGIFFFYLLLTARFKSVWFGVLGSSMFFLSPKTFEGYTNNPKELTFISLSIIAVYFAYKFINKSSKINLLITALFSAILIGFRIDGLVLPLTVIVLFAYNFITKALATKMNLGNLLGYILTTLLFILVFSQGRMTGDFGGVFKVVGVLWNSPTIYAFLFVAGLLLLVKNWKLLKTLDMLVFGWVFLSPYPALVYSGVYAIYKIKNEWVRTLLVIIIPILFVLMAKDILAANPLK